MEQRRFFMQGRTVCDICGNPLTSSDFVKQKDAEWLACTSAMCRLVIHDARKMKPPLAERHIEIFKNRLKQKREEKLARDAYTREILEKEGGENHAIFAAVTKTRSRYSPANLYTLPIPCGGEVMGKPGSEKLEGYRSNLTELISKAFAIRPGEDEQTEGEADISSGSGAETEVRASENPAYATINGQICGICKGGCCATGGNHAYIQVETILRVRRQYPDWSEEDVLQAYLSRLGPESINGSCINQTDTRCVLPVELRSDICNSFFCSGMRRLHEHMQRQGETTAILAIQRSNNNFNAFDPGFENQVLRVVLIDGDEIEEIDQGGPGAR
jgi:hypothetical protein